MRTYISGKIHGIRVTNKSIAYHGSVTISTTLLKEAGIEEFEQVHIVNLNNGHRWTTYAIAGDHGAFYLNGGGARLGEVGDVCVIMTYSLLDSFNGAHVVFCDEKNRVSDALVYRRSGTFGDGLADVLDAGA